MRAVVCPQTKSRQGNAFRTVKTAVRDTFLKPRKWKKVLAHVELERYLENNKIMTDPKILESRKKSVPKPWGAKCNIAPHLLPRPLDKCELFDLEQEAAEREARQLAEYEASKAAAARREDEVKAKGAAEGTYDIEFVHHDNED